MVQVPFGWGGLNYKATLDEGFQDFTHDDARGSERLDLAMKLGVELRRYPDTDELAEFRFLDCFGHLILRDLRAV
jgi:hypothetical protein